MNVVTHRSIFSCFSCMQHTKQGFSREKAGRM